MSFNVYTGLKALLLSEPTISSLVGTRVYPVKLPQKVTFPAITLLVVSEPRENILDDAASAARPRVQVDCWVREVSGAASFKSVQTLGHAVTALLDGYAGLMTDSTSSPAIVVRAGIVMRDKRDLFEGDADGGIHRHSADYEVFHGVNGM